MKIPWYAETNTWGKERERSADCYVFCHYTETDVKRANVLNLDDWDFYVLSKKQ
jgi:hypothetical protein